MNELDKKVEKFNEVINVYNRTKIEISGVIEVLSSTEKEVLAKLENDFLIIKGSSLKIVKLIPEEKFLVVNGNIIAFEYFSKLNKKSFLGKVFK